MTIDDLERGALAILAGAKAEAAAAVSLQADQVAAAAIHYHNAGRDALEYHANRSPWQHLTVRITEQVGAHQLPPRSNVRRWDADRLMVPP